MGQLLEQDSPKHDEQKPVLNVLRWIGFIPIGLVAFLLGSMLGNLINYLTTISFLGSTGGIIATYGARLIVECLALYISISIASAIAPNEKIGGIIYCAFMLIYLGIAITLALMGYGENSSMVFFFVEMIAYSILIVIAIVKISQGEKLMK